MENLLATRPVPPPHEVGSYIAGIDLGGTSIKIGLLLDDSLISRDQISTSDYDSPADAFLTARQLLERALADQGRTFDDLTAVGLAMAGVIDEQAATLKESANLHEWKNIEFLSELQSVIDKPLAAINDANAAALGESAFGKRRARSMALLTLGTGIGGGLIVGGRPVSGSHGCGGEIGHVTIDHSPTARRCGCGRFGHLEAYAGAAGIVQTAKEALLKSDEVSLLRSVDKITPEEIAEAAHQGDHLALETIRATGVHLGRAIAMLAQIADPAIVLLGGAMTFGGSKTETGKMFLKTIRNEVVRLSLVQAGSGIEIDFATLGNDAGLLGAAHYARTLILKG